ncbi:MAG: hypothetical protein DI539_24245, partial [Flavobacterium psychrophilum]
DYYEPHMVNATDYYAFGMPSRVASSATGAGYRFGFNGKENDNEVKGFGNQQDYGMRIYDARVGRFLSVDPLDKKFPYWSPYHFSANNPIRFIDLDGAEPINPSIKFFLTEAFPTILTKPNSTKAKVYAAVMGVANTVTTPALVFENLLDDPWGTVQGLGKGLWKMLTKSPTENALDYSMSMVEKYRDLPGPVQEYAVKANALSDIAFMLTPVKKVLINPKVPLVQSSIRTSSTEALNVKAGSTLAIPKPKINSYFGSEFLNDAIRMVEQPLTVVESKAKYWIQGSNKSSLSTLMKGQYSVESIVGNATRNFTLSLREGLNALGEKYGCHTCGVKAPGTKSGNWIPDHQPPLSLQPDGPFELLPHCRECSVTQGGQTLQALKPKVN